MARRKAAQSRLKEKKRARREYRAGLREDAVADVKELGLTGASTKYGVPVSTLFAWVNQRGTGSSARSRGAARRTDQARLNPVVRQLLAAAFARLALSDIDGKLQDAIARYPLSPVIDGIAIFEGKRAADSLPPGVDGRYLLGIVRNVAQQRESELISEAMLRARLAAQDVILAPLVERHRRAIAAEPPDAPGLLQNFVAHALDSDRYLDRLFPESGIQACKVVDKRR